MSPSRSPKNYSLCFGLIDTSLIKSCRLPAQIITTYAKKLGVIPGIFVTLHTFGRDLKRNMHFHLSTTLSGLSLDQSTWMLKFRFNKKALAAIKQIWRNEIITLLRNEFKADQLLLPKHFSDNNNQLSFNQWLNQQNQKTWVVHFSKSSNNHFRVVNYLGRYLKKPPIGETRIKNYDGASVTYAFFDHHEKTQHFMTLPVHDFIKKLIAHIPDRYFRVVRYYNWLSNRTRGQLLPFIYKKLKQVVKKITKLAWRELIIKTFGKDPLLCPQCKKTILTLIDRVYAYNTKKLINNHHKVADPNAYLTT